MNLDFLKRKDPLKGNISKHFIDIHSHILPCVDDGSQSNEQSLTLLKLMVELGIKHLVLTPHIMETVWENESEDLKIRFQEFKNYLHKENFHEIQLYLAAEYMLDGNFQSLLKSERLLTISDSYILVEMSYLNPPINLYELLFDIQIAGYTPILAHPERYNFLHNNFEEYIKLKNAGCLLQMNLLSVTNYYGKNVKDTAMKLLKESMIDFVGSDTHHEHHLKHLESINKPSLLKLLRPILLNNEKLYN